MDFGIDKQIEETRKQVKQLKRLLPKNVVPGAFQEAIDVLYKNDALKPLVIEQHLETVNGEPYKPQKKSIKKHVRDSAAFAKKFMSKEPLDTERNEGWFFVVSLPPGLLYSDFKNKEQHFADAVKGSCHIEKHGKAVFVWLSNLDLGKFYLYDFNPAPFKEMLVPAHFGISSRGPIIRDIVDTHILIGGETRWGKSVLMHCLAYGFLLANTVRIQKILPCFIDFKRMEFKEFDPWAWRVTDQEGAKFMLYKTLEEIDRRAVLFSKAGVRKIQDYLYRGFQLPYIIIMLDEMHKLKNEEAQEMLQTILATGAGFGILVIAASQRPSSTIFKGVKFGDLKANFDCKISFRTATEIDSRIILDNDAAAYLPPVKGRAIFQWDIQTETQTLYFPLHPKEDKQLQTFLSRLGQQRFSRRSDVRDKQRIGILPGSKNCFLGGRENVFDI
jgi:S-DNA-T family DNA segregation ATPase FtsK/SpoIIIE